jgi:hypothetical protein
MAEGSLGIFFGYAQACGAGVVGFYNAGLAQVSVQALQLVEHQGAKNPSPAVASSIPRKRVSCRRTRTWCFEMRSRHARSPTSAAFAVEPTTSVKDRGKHTF